MSKVARFEDLVAWQKARELTRIIYAISRKGAWSRDYGLAGQIQRAAVSIMSNIAEGFERGGRAEFHQFLSTAKASCAEVRSQLYVAYDAGYLTSEEFESLRAMAEEVTRIVGGLRSAVERQRDSQRADHLRVRPKKGNVPRRSSTEAESSVPSPQSFPSRCRGAGGVTRMAGVRRRSVGDGR